MILLLLGCTPAPTGGAPEDRVAPLPASSEHVGVVYAHGSGSIGVGIAEEVIRYNLPMMESCAVQANVPDGTCAHVRFTLERPLHGGTRVSLEGGAGVPEFSGCLRRELADPSFPSPEHNAPGATFDAAIVVAWPADNLGPCVARESERAVGH